MRRLFFRYILFVDFLLGLFNLDFKKMCLFFSKERCHFISHSFIEVGIFLCFYFLFNVIVFLQIHPIFPTSSEPIKGSHGALCFSVLFQFLTVLLINKHFNRQKIAQVLEYFPV